MIIEQCKDCLYHITVTTRIDRLETDVEDLQKEVSVMHTSVELQKQSTEMILSMLAELKVGLNRVEAALADRKDSFRDTMYDLGVFAIKATVTLGGVAAAIMAVAKQIGRL